jgi:hypothetical protein
MITTQIERTILKKLFQHYKTEILEQAKATFTIGEPTMRLSDIMKMLDSIERSVNEHLVK